MLGLNFPEPNCPMRYPIVICTTGDFVIREPWELGLLIIWFIVTIKFVKFIWKSGDK